MLLTYVDESYDRQLYWIAALMCTDDCVVELTSLLDEVSDWSARTYDTPLDAEFHGHAIFHGLEDWTKLATMPRARIGVYHKVLEAIAATEPEICIRGVDVARLNQRYGAPDHPHSIVLQHLLEDVDRRAEARGERALVIADDIDAPNDHRRDLRHFQRYSTPGYKARKLTRIVDTMHFAPSHASRLLQAVDMVAFLHYRIQSGRDTDSRAVRANHALWGRLDGVVYKTHCWTP